MSISLASSSGVGSRPRSCKQLALDAAELVDHLDHVHRDADGAGLVGHRAGDRLPDPPGGIGGELVTLCVVELLDRTDQAEVALLDQVEERHAAAGVALGQRHHQSQVRFQQMVFRAVAVAADPRHVAALSGGQLLALLGDLAHQLGGVQAGLDPLGQLDLFFGVEQRDLADLLEVGAYRVGRCGEFGVLAGLPQRLGLLLVPDEVAGCLVLLARLGDLVVLGGRRFLGGDGGLPSASAVGGLGAGLVASSPSTSSSSRSSSSTSSSTRVIVGLAVEFVGGLELVVLGAVGLGGRRLGDGRLLGAAARGARRSWRLRGGRGLGRRAPSRAWPRASWRRACPSWSCAGLPWWLAWRVWRARTRWRSWLPWPSSRESW